MEADDLLEFNEIIPGDMSKEALDAIKKAFDGRVLFIHTDGKIGCRVLIRPINFPDWFLRQFDTGELETNVFLWKVQAPYRIDSICRAYERR